MRFSGTERDDDEPWFRLGTLEVTTTVFVLLVWTATLVVFTVEPVSKPVQTALALIPSEVRSGGEVWRMFTWPWAHDGFQLWTIIDAVLFFFFGTQLEKQLGRPKFTILLGWSIVIISACAVLFSVLLPSDPTVIADLRLLELTVLLLFIAEYPKMPFFFGIPAWVIGAVIVALEVVNDLAYRYWVQLLTVLLAGLLIALMAKKLGLLASYDRVPDLRLPGRRGRSKGEGPGASSAPRSASKPQKPAKPGKSGPLWSKRKDDEPAEILEMPTQRPRPRAMPSSSMPDVSADDLALDALLDKIADGGLGSLSTAERQELDDLRARRRGPKP